MKNRIARAGESSAEAIRFSAQEQTTIADSG
jgi:hypothetical protein